MKDMALAEALFRKGKELAGAGRLDEGCAKLAESLRLDPAGGTSLALAHCYEAAGKLASAWAEFSDAVAYAQRDGRTDREQEARARIEAIEPRLDRIRVLLARPAAVVEVRRGGRLIPSAAVGLAVPVDAGDHEVVASAAGFQSWSRRVSVGATGAVHTLTVPELVPLPMPIATATAERLPRSQAGFGANPVADRPTPTRPQPERQRTDTTRLAVASAALGVGAAGLAVGTLLGVSALKKSSDADAACPTTRCEDPNAVRLSRDAVRDAQLATISFAIAAGALGAGAFLLLTAPSPNASSSSAPAQERRSTQRLVIAPTAAGGAVVHFQGAF